MAYRTWATGETITASLLNAQSPTLCTSATRPTGGNLYEGVLITETDTDRILYYDGTGWTILAEPFQNWGVTITGYTAGNGTADAEYHRSDGWCDVRMRLTLGTTSAVTGALLLTLPVAAAKNTQVMQFTGGFYDASAGAHYPAICSLTGNATQVYLYAANSTVAYSPHIATTAAIPFAWANGDIIDFSGRYRMTTRYS